MTMLTLSRCRQVAGGAPNVASAEFRSAVATVAARLRITFDPGKREGLEKLQAALLAHGEPVEPRKPSREELSAIRRDASAKGLVARSKASLTRKLISVNSGLVSVSDRKPAVFDAALEMIEDGQAWCVHQVTETVKLDSGDQVARRVTLAATFRPLPSYSMIRDCEWKSRRRQEEEDRI